MKQNILVTGGAGFIGSFYVDQLIKEGHTVTIFDNLEPQVHLGKMPDYLNKDAKLVKADIRDYDAIKDAVLDADKIINFAARVGVGQSMYDIKDYVDTNDRGTANLLHALANEEHNVKKVLVASSMSIYGEGSYKCEGCSKVFHDVERKQEDMENHIWEPLCPDCGESLKAIPTGEDKPLSSSSVYAISKKNQEEYTLNVGKAYGIPSIAMRFFNTYGPRQSLSNPYTGVAAIFMSRIKNDKAPLIFEDGNQGRDFVSVHDIIKGCNLALNSNAANYEVFNVGTGKKTTVLEVADALINIYDSKVKPVVNNQFRKGDIRHCFADISKIKSKLDFEPSVSLKEGMTELVEWSRDQEAKDEVQKAYDELKEKRLV